MPVAKSYANMKIVGDPYIVSGRQYVQVDTGKGLRQVRWYTDAEYRKMYPVMNKATDEVLKKDDPYYKPQKEVLGFTKGYITIFKGDTYSEIDWFRASIARYARWWGWYIISTEEIPADLPAGIEPIQLSWDLVGQEDGKLKPEHLVKEAVESLIYEGSDSEYQGNIGDRLELFVTVDKAIELDGNYGHSTMHIMRDDFGNFYVWTTAAKSWVEGSEHHIKGTVKDHRTYRNEKQTVLTRCTEVK